MFQCAALVRVVDVTHPCDEHVTFTVQASHFPESHPGQFLQLQCRPAGDDAPRLVEWREGESPNLMHAASAAAQPLLRRPFSIADRWDDGSRAFLTVISRAIGRGTTWLDALRAGDELDVSGPHGQGFRLPRQSRPIVLVGGGVGIPPLLYAARELQARGMTDVTVVFGVTTGALLPLKLLCEPSADGAALVCLDLPGGAGYPAIVTTDDGTLGLPGRVTDGLAQYNARHAPDAQTPLVLACGPEPMLAAVARSTRQLGYDCQLCIERYMGCGLGTCLSCVVRVYDATGGVRWALSCQEGPVFDRDVLAATQDVET